MVLYFAHYVLRAVTPFEFFDRYILHESGATEQGTVLVLVLALLTGLLVLRQASSLGDKRLLLFFGLFCLGCLYFGGEEASWGQHWFGWATPDQWRALNNQAETNLHNSNSLAGSLLDQLPRNLLAIAMLVGGCILPIRRWLRGRSYAQGSFGYWAMPTFDCVVIGFVAPLASIPEKLFEAALGDVPYPFDIDGGEVKELMFAVFLCLYIVTVLVRIRRKAITPRPSAA